MAQPRVTAEQGIPDQLPAVRFPQHDRVMVQLKSNALDSVAAPRPEFLVSRDFTSVHPTSDVAL